MSMSTLNDVARDLLLHASLPIRSRIDVIVRTDLLRCRSIERLPFAIVDRSYEPQSLHLLRFLVKSIMLFDTGVHFTLLPYPSP